LKGCAKLGKNGERTKRKGESEKPKGGGESRKHKDEGKKIRRKMRGKIYLKQKDKNTRFIHPYIFVLLQKLNHLSLLCFLL